MDKQPHCRLSFSTRRIESRRIVVEAGGCELVFASGPSVMSWPTLRTSSMSAGMPHCTLVTPSVHQNQSSNLNSLLIQPSDPSSPITVQKEDKVRECFSIKMAQLEASELNQRMMSWSVTMVIYRFKNVLVVTHLKVFRSQGFLADLLSSQNPIIRTSITF